MFHTKIAIEKKNERNFKQNNIFFKRTNEHRYWIISFHFDADIFFGYLTFCLVSGVATSTCQFKAHRHVSKHMNTCSHARPIECYNKRFGKNIMCVCVRVCVTSRLWKCAIDECELYCELVYIQSVISFKLWVNIASMFEMNGWCIRMTIFASLLFLIHFHLVKCVHMCVYVFMLFMEIPMN